MSTDVSNSGVHAVGYNWLQSNRQSAERLATEIERIVGHYASRKKVCEKVIVVTHSMGGLVARACAQLPGMQEKILGVVHGVMPALGAPATYKRMRAGFEGVASALLGRDAAEATAVVAHSPGALELLPTRQYRSRGKSGTTRHWLRASHTALEFDGTPGERSNFLGENDFYADIYLNNSAQVWWRMVKEELIDPAGRGQYRARQDGKKSTEERDHLTDFDRYAKVLIVAEQLHVFIEDAYHPVTYVYYAADPHRPTWNEVHWKCDQNVTGTYLHAHTVDDDQRGRLRIRVGELTSTFAIEAACGSGDGTVPEESGAAPTSQAVQAFRHGGEPSGHTSYEHQHAYSSDVAEATTLYSIVRMVSDSAWLKTNLHKG